jgi:hypothetical protein
MHQNGTPRGNAAGHASFTVGETTYRLRLDHNALADFEEDQRQTVLEVFSPDDKGQARVGFAAIRALFYAGTLPRLANKKAAGDLVQALGLENAVPVVEAAVKAAFPTAVPETETEDVASAPGPFVEEGDGTGTG